MASDVTGCEGYAPGHGMVEYLFRCFGLRPSLAQALNEVFGLLT